MMFARCEDSQARQGEHAAEGVCISINRAKRCSGYKAIFVWRSANVTGLHRQMPGSPRRPSASLLE